MTTKRLPRVLVTTLLLGTAAGCASGTDPVEEPTPLFAEDFESGLGQWTGRVTGHHAQLAADPLHSGNTAVNFTRTVAAGDLFSLPISVDVDALHTLTFEYLGLPTANSKPNDLGGFLGISDGTPGEHYWLYGPVANAATHQLDLADDGSWHTYSVTFIPSSIITPTEGTIRIMIEDGEGVGSLPGDAYFDNIKLYRTADLPVH